MFTHSTNIYEGNHCVCAILDAKIFLSFSILSPMVIRVEMLLGCSTPQLTGLEKIRF